MSCEQAWSVGNIGDLLVRETFQLAQDQRLAELGGQCFQRLTEELPVTGSEELHVRLLCGVTRDLRHAVVICVAGKRGRRRALLSQPRVTRVAHDSEHPGAGISPAVAVEGPQGAKIRFLYHVLGVLVVVGQPAGQIVASGEVRHDDTLEALQLFRLSRFWSARI